MSLGNHSRAALTAIVGLALTSGELPAREPLSAVKTAEAKTTALAKTTMAQVSSAKQLDFSKPRSIEIDANSIFTGTIDYSKGAQFEITSPSDIRKDASMLVVVASDVTGKTHLIGKFCFASPESKDKASQQLSWDNELKLWAAGIKTTSMVVYQFYPADGSDLATSFTRDLTVPALKVMGQIGKSTSLRICNHIGSNPTSGNQFILRFEKDRILTFYPVKPE